ncbi:MAG: 23S rRNA (adenine(2503)-C(2))-methyltransferase RlmN [Steroidobacteraceae bacterium]
MQPTADITTNDRVNLLGLTRSQLEELVVGMGEKPFRARQLMKWLYKRAVGNFDEMTDLAKAFRERIKLVAEVRVPEVTLRQHSVDGTRKWLLSVDRGIKSAPQAIEMVYIPEPGRGTLCISSQVGCAMDCGFCSTAQQGFNSNLTAAEIVGQVWLANREIRGDQPVSTDTAERLITNVVFMGMGEPLANYRNVMPATEILMDDLGFDISRRRVTVSTSGLVPQMRKLAEETNCALAVSLHAPNDALRDQLVPINRKHKLSELLDACWYYLQRQNARSITFEYVMLDGVNDQLEHARELVTLLKHKPAKVNLIPFNPFPDARYQRSPVAVISRFRDHLNANGVIATTRRTRGDDIDAACGQLVGRVQNRTTVRLGSKLVSLVAEV